MKLLSAIIAVWVAVLIALPHAWAKDDANEQAKIELTKAELAEFQAQARHANSVIAKAYGRYDDEQGN